jgi:TIR domain
MVGYIAGGRRPLCGYNLRELTQAHAVIVIWSSASVKSDWVRSEATRAHSRGVLIPVRAEDLRIEEIPAPFDVLHTDFVTNRRSIDSALAKLGLRPRNADQSTSQPTVPAKAAPDDHDTEEVKIDAQVLDAHRDVVVLVHDIRDFALWQSKIRATLQKAGLVAEPTNYGRFSLFRFLAPVPFFRRWGMRSVPLRA